MLFSTHIFAQEVESVPVHFPNVLDYPDYPNTGTAVYRNGYVIVYNGTTWDTLSTVNGAGSSLWTQVGSDIYYNTGNVGIGTTTPVALLGIESSTAGEAIYEFYKADDGGHLLRMLKDVSDNAILELYTGGGAIGAIIQANSVSIFNGGNVGIGSNVPVYKLDVNGTLRATGTATFDGVLTAIGNVGIGTTTPNQKLTIEGTMSLKEQAAAGTNVAAYGQLWVKTATPNTLWFTDDAGTDVQLGIGISGTGTTNYISKWTGASTQGDGIMFDNGTNIGISDATPTHKLDVNGSFRATGLATFDNIIFAGSAIVGLNSISATGNITTVTGNVGIGSGTPGAKLDVKSTTNITAFEIDANATSENTVLINGDNTSKYVVSINGGGANTTGASLLVGSSNSGHSAPLLVFKVGGTGGKCISTFATNEDLTIDPNGSGQTLITGDVTTNTDIYCRRVLESDPWHAYGGFQDSAVNISITQGNYTQITNASGDLFTGIEADGFTLSGDTLTMLNAGDYTGTATISFTGGNTKVYRARIWDATAGEQEGFSKAVTGQGVGNIVSVTIPAYFVALTNDKYILQITNEDGNEDAVMVDGTFIVLFEHL